MSVLVAPAKLTLSLKIVGRRPDGYHEIDSEMVTVDLADTLEIGDGTGLVVRWAAPARPAVGSARSFDTGEGNLVNQALRLSGRRARVVLTKRIPVGGGLGGGSADAGAVLRWAGVRDAHAAVSLGSDVPFCVEGGRARVTGTGEGLEQLPFQDRRFLLLVPPLSVDTAAVYQAWDTLDGSGRRRHTSPDGVLNDLEEAACTIAPELLRWRDAFGDELGVVPRLAGSGSTWFAELDQARPTPSHPHAVVVDGQRASVVAVRTVRAQL